MPKLISDSLLLLQQKSNMSLRDIKPTKGTYTLIIFLSEDLQTKIGQQGIRTFPKGYYTYTGSACGTGSSSLRHRLSRHLRKNGKKRHWHIDYLLAHEEATVTAIVAAQTPSKMECELNDHIKRQGHAEIPVSGFGSSDCKRNCESHLVFFHDITEEKELAKLVFSCYEDLGCQPFYVRRYA